MDQRTTNDVAGRSAARHAIIQSAGQFPDLARSDLLATLRVLDLLTAAAQDAAIPHRGTESSAERAQARWRDTHASQLQQAHALLDELAQDWDRA